MLSISRAEWFSRSHGSIRRKQIRVSRIAPSRAESSRAGPSRIGLGQEVIRDFSQMRVKYAIGRRGRGFKNRMTADNRLRNRARGSDGILPPRSELPANFFLSRISLIFDRSLPYTRNWFLWSRSIAILAIISAFIESLRILIQEYDRWNCQMRIVNSRLNLFNN